MPLRLLWIFIGLLSLACGIAGIVLTLVPTTPFLLVAAFAFARSSPFLHEWLVTHPRLGSAIADWNAHGAISPRSKIAAIIVMLLALALNFGWGFSWNILIVQSLILTIVAMFIQSRPDGPDEGV